MRKSFLILSAAMIVLAGACRTATDSGMEGTQTPAPSSGTYGTTESGSTSSGGYGTTEASAGAYGSATASQGQVQVTLNDYRIDMPDSLPVGRTTFHVMNYGRIPHSFGIRGGAPGSTYGGMDGYDRRLASDLASGQMANLEVDLQPGVYTAYCPVGNHATTHQMLRLVTVK
jgi:hypothetical protein